MRVSEMDWSLFEILLSRRKAVGWVDAARMVSR